MDVSRGLAVRPEDQPPGASERLKPLENGLGARRAEPVVELARVALVVRPDADLACMHGPTLLTPRPRCVVVLGATVDRLNVEEEPAWRLTMPPRAANLRDHVRQGYAGHAGIRDNGWVTARGRQHPQFSHQPQSLFILRRDNIQ